MRYRVGDIVKQIRCDPSEELQDAHFVVTRVINRPTGTRYRVFWLERGFECHGDYSLHDSQPGAFYYRKIKGDY